MHTNPDLLALVALGEDAIDDHERSHLDSCPVCRAELAELTQAVEVGRRTTAADTMHGPSPRVWLAIRDELGLAGPPAPVASTPVATSTMAVPTAVSTGRWHRGRLLIAVLAAAVALVAGFGVGLNWNQLTARKPVASITVSLNALPAWPGASGKASIETDASGNRYLVVQVNARPTPVGARQEVWLSDTLALHMTAMGFLEDGKGRFMIPPGMNPHDSPLVDVSEEPPNDTNPAHSQNSIVRGRLPV